MFSIIFCGLKLMCSLQIRILEGPQFSLTTHLYADSFQIFLFCPDLYILPSADFILFMKHLYLDVLPSPKSKHEKKKKKEFMVSLQPICSFLFFIFRQRPWVFPCPVPVTHIWRLASHSDSYSVIFHFCFSHFHSLILVYALYFQTYFRGFQVNHLSIFFSYFHGLYESCRILSFKCLLSSKTNFIPDFNNLAAGMWLQGGTYFIYKFKHKCLLM